MVIFDLFKRKKKACSTEMSEENKRWNRMWELWSDGEIESPINELMTYSVEVNNGGHGQYFDNTSNNGEIGAEMSALNEILPCVLKVNLNNAYKSHLMLEQDETNTEAEDALKKCDSVFFENEKLINDILCDFSTRL